MALSAQLRLCLLELKGEIVESLGSPGWVRVRGGVVVMRGEWFGQGCEFGDEDGLQRSWGWG